MAGAVQDWTPAFQETAITLENIFSNDVFNTEGAVINQTWSPLKQAYAAQKAKKYPGQGILQATGAMRNSFQGLWTANMAQVFNTADYFKYHQSNQPRSGNLPRRAMIALAEAQRRQIVRIFNTYFQKTIAAQ